MAFADRNSRIKLIYLLFLSIKVIIFIDINYINASPWVPKVDSYKYYFTTHIVDKDTIKNRQLRYEGYRLIEQDIGVLYLEQENLSSQDNEYQLIEQKIKELKEAQKSLQTYQDNRLFTTEIEYGLTKDSSWGIKSCYKRNIAPNGKSYATDLAVFYKQQLFNNGRHLFTISPRIYHHKNKHYHDEVYGELIGSIGKINQKHSTTFMIYTSVSYAKGINRYAKNLSYYSASSAETIKIPYGFMVSSFSEVTHRKDTSPAYRDTFYQEVTIAKEFNINNNLDNQLNIKAGYFWYNSLHVTSLRTSGFTLATWLAI